MTSSEFLKKKENQRLAGIKAAATRKANAKKAKRSDAARRAWVKIRENRKEITVDLSPYSKEVRMVINDEIKLNGYGKRKFHSTEIFSNVAMNHSGCNGPEGCSQRTIDALYKLHNQTFRKGFKLVTFK
jgi:hypothetical protein